MSLLNERDSESVCPHCGCDEASAFGVPCRSCLQASEREQQMIAFGVSVEKFRKENPLPTFVNIKVKEKLVGKYKEKYGLSGDIEKGFVFYNGRLEKDGGVTIVHIGTVVTLQPSEFEVL